MTDMRLTYDVQTVQGEVQDRLQAPPHGRSPRGLELFRGLHGLRAPDPEVGAGEHGKEPERSARTGGHHHGFPQTET